jgi:hypothetical protein
MEPNDLPRHRRRVRRGRNPTSKHLTLAMINAGVEKENPWVKLVRTVDLLEEKAPEVGLQKKFQLSHHEYNITNQ